MRRRTPPPPCYSLPPYFSPIFLLTPGVLLRSPAFRSLVRSPRRLIKKGIGCYAGYRKCSSRLYFLRQLKRSGVAPSELLLFYVTCIRPVLEYASPVFHRSLLNYISEDLERIQRRALRIIHPDLSYRVALETAGLPKLNKRRERISTDLFDEIVCDPTHRLHSLLPQRKSCKYALRRKSDFTLPKCKTERLKNSFIFSHVYNM